LHKVVAFDAKRYGLDHPATLRTRQALADNYVATGKRDEAFVLLEEILHARLEQLGPDHPETLYTEECLAGIYRAEGDQARYQQMVQELLEKRTATLGPDHLSTLSSKLGVAEIYKSQGKFDEAETLYQQVIDGRQASLGAEHAKTAFAKYMLALLYHYHLEKHDQAERLYREVAESRNGDEKHRIRARIHLAVLHQEQKRADQADQVFHEALPDARRLLEPHEQEWLRLFIHNQIGCRLTLSQPEKAEPLSRELAGIIRERYGAESMEYARELGRLGWLLTLQRRGSDAVAPFRESLAIHEKQQPDDWNTFNLRSLLGEALTASQDYSAAEPVLLEAYEGLKQRAAQIPAEKKRDGLPRAAGRLAQLYHAWGNKDEAARWRKESEELLAQTLQSVE
jgi:tetratricopeptide (TPR) repeat protein